ncbi:glycoside hydrolase domain-containing protein [Phocaeicola plebeius]|uniref:glycoside hydrolase domain-containing protein n=1 Tax=Phocaeicola plebeius TaxID=310297 RepID=UPI002942FE19|nr:glycoside hydrolase domain-containing protein [Phocaeicola plebeius]
MKTMIYSLALAALVSLGSCTNDDPVLTQKDWQGTATYFASTDEQFTTYYKPAVGYVGDPMPFYDPVEQNFKILYLQDFRPNPANTYHPIWGVSTKDLSSYQSLGELIPTGTAAEADAALGTGSTIYNEADKLYYTFYTGHTAKQEVVMMATSSDFKTWTKSKSFYLQGGDYGYSVKDFRDPFVFKGDDGQYHMIISTLQGTKGVLVEFTSSDLKSWAHGGIFMSMMWDRFYECPDIFKMGDWWYLVYSEKMAAVRRVQYFKGHTLDELKACTANEAGVWPDNKEGFLDSRAFYAGKTASDGTNRYIWGWCPTRAGNDNTAVGAAPNEPEWAGNLVAHRIIQHEDGTLSLGNVEGIDKKYSSESSLKVMAKSGNGVSENGSNYVLTGNAYVLFNRLNVCNKLSFTVKTTSKTDKFGFSFVRGTDSEKYYSIIVNPEDGGDNKKLNFEEEGGKGFINGIDGYKFATPANNEYNVTVYTDNSVCVVYINDNVVYTNRIYGLQKNCWSINSYEGTVEVSNVRVNYY